MQQPNNLGMILYPTTAGFDCITQIVRQVFPMPIALISLVSSKCKWLQSAQNSTTQQTDPDITFCAQAILGKDTLIVPDTLLDPDFSDNPLVTGEPHIRFYAGQPVFYNGSAIGALCIMDTVPHPFSASEQESLRNLAICVENELKVSGLTATQRELITQLDDARRAALIDPLTKVWNRRAMDELLPREIIRCQRARTPFALMLMDVDNFKAINDNYSHLIGDFTLKEVAQRIGTSVRPQDLVLRYGGDEFMVFLGNCDVATAHVIVERILTRINEVPITHHGDLSLVTGLSVGVVTVSDATNKSKDIQNIVLTADSALYLAKREKRGQAQFKAL